MVDKWWHLLYWAPFPHPSPHTPPPFQLHLLLLALLLPCLVSYSMLAAPFKGGNTTVQSIFSSIMWLIIDQFDGTIGDSQAFTCSLVKMEKRGTWRQKRRPKGDQNPGKGRLGDQGPLKGNPYKHNAILVSYRGVVLSSNISRRITLPALEDTSHVGLAVPQSLSHSEYF